MKKLMATLFILVLLISAGSAITFADTTEVAIENPFERPILTEEEKAQARYDKMVELLDTYLSSRTQEWIDGYAEHESVHEDLTAVTEEVSELFTNYKEEKKALTKAEIEDLKAQIQAGEITREEAAELFNDFIAEYADIQEDTQAFRTEFEALKEIGTANKEARDAAREAMLAAIEVGSDDVSELLNTLVDLQFEHLEFDYTKLAHHQERVEYLQNLNQ